MLRLKFIDSETDKWIVSDSVFYVAALIYVVKVNVTENTVLKVLLRQGKCNWLYLLEKKVIAGKRKVHEIYLSQRNDWSH